MRYQFCPLCGKELSPHHHGKYCKECAAEQRRKTAKRVAIAAGVTVAVGAAAVGVAAYKNKRIRKRIVKLAKRFPVQQSAAVLQQTANAATLKAKELLQQADVLREQATAQLLAQAGSVRDQAMQTIASIDLPNPFA